jgi:hypothetical protein
MWTICLVVRFTLPAVEDKVGAHIHTQGAQFGACAGYVQGTNRVHPKCFIHSMFTVINLNKCGRVHDDVRTRRPECHLYCIKTGAVNVRMRKANRSEPRGRP